MQELEGLDKLEGLEELEEVEELEGQGQPGPACHSRLVKLRHAPLCHAPLRHAPLCRAPLLPRAKKVALGQTWLANPRSAPQELPEPG